MRLAGALLPVETAPAERRLRLRVRDALARFPARERREGRKLAAASFGHESPQALVVVGEVLERARCPPLLSHEQQRCFGREQEQHGGRAPLGGVDLVVQPLAHRPVADLVVVLQEHDEVARRHASRVRAPRPTEVLRVLALEEPAVGERPGRVLERAREVAVVAIAVTREPHAQLVVEVVRPDRVEGPPAPLLRLHDVDQIPAVLRNHEDAARVRRLSHACLHLGEQVSWRLVDERPAGIHPQSVDVVLADPVSRVLDEELAHGAARLAIQVHRRAPRGSMRLGQIPRAETGEMRAVRSGMVVDDVEENGEAKGVRAVDEPPQGIGRAVLACRGEEVHPVVAPVPPPGKRPDRQELDRAHPEIPQVGQPIGHRLERARAAEGADVELVDHEILEGRGAPRLVGPLERCRVDQLRGAVHALRLRARGRIGKGPLAVEPVPIERSRLEAGDHRRPVAAGRSLEGDSLSRASGPVLVRLDDQLDALPVRRPHAKPRASGLDPGSERRPPPPAAHFPARPGRFPEGPRRLAGAFRAFGRARAAGRLWGVARFPVGVSAASALRVFSGSFSSTGAVPPPSLLKKTTLSGGSVTCSEKGCPWLGVGVASSPPKLPNPWPQ